MNESKLSVLLVFGGESSEHEVSIKSAANVYASMDKDRYDVRLCYVSHDGKGWSLVESFDALEGRELLPHLGHGSFTTQGTELKIDVIVPILHGKHGEDGEVQGLASLLHIPCVGPSLIGASTSMDKDLTKRLLRDAGVPVVDWLLWRTSESAPVYTHVSEKLGDKLFIKPSNAGSSVGVSLVSNEEGFKQALTLAAVHDDIVLIERAIVGKEVELAVLGNDDIRIATPGEIIPEDTFYSYDAKYAATSMAHDKIPADLNNDIVSSLKDYAAVAYKAVRGRGMARIDFFVTDEGEIFLNEINSIPGFTDISMYPKMWRFDGVSYSELIDELITLAVDL